MATEKNPYEPNPQQQPNVIPIGPTQPQSEQQQPSPTFELEDDGGVIVDFANEDITMEPSQAIEEWYGDLSETLDNMLSKREQSKTFIEFQKEKKILNRIRIC